MKIVITGLGGFAGRHFLDLLRVKEPGATVIGIDRHVSGINTADYPDLNIEMLTVDLQDQQAVQHLLDLHRPGYILHLASASSVAESWASPKETFENNTGIFLNLLETTRILGFPCRIVSAGSSEVYGNVPESKLPILETNELNPLSPYAVAKLSQEMLAKVYATAFGMDIMVTRSFNHIGPGQKEQFAVASFAKQLVQLTKENGPVKKISTGDLTVTRDFCDVRDVVEAYYLLFKKGTRGEVYNVCSGKGVALGEIIRKMCTRLNIEVVTETDPARTRPNEISKIIGSNDKIKRELGWQPQISLEQSLDSIIDHWQKVMAS